MKKFITLCLVAICSCINAAAQEISLPTPNLKRGSAFMKTLSERKSQREFSETKLDKQDLADLLWAAIGKSREDGKLTAPTAKNKQEIRLFVFAKDMVTEYQPQTHTMKAVLLGDYRALVAGGQAFAASAPVSLVIVADMEKFGADNERARMMVCVDAGIVCQNINLFCASAGLATVPRATMDTAGIQKLLGLSEKQIPVMNNPVGYVK